MIKFAAVKCTLQISKIDALNIFVFRVASFNFSVNLSAY